MIEQVDQANRAAGRGKVLVQAAGQAADQLGIGLDYRRAHTAPKEQVVGQHDPIPRRDRPDLVATVAVEGHERQGLLRPPKHRGLAAMPNLERTAPKRRRQSHHERPDHPVILLRVLVLDKELPTRIHQHRVQLGPQRAARRKAKIATHTVKHRQQRLIPASLIDPHTALGDLQRIADAPVQHSLLSSPIPSRPTHQAQLPRLLLRHRKLDRPHTPHPEVQVTGGSSPRSDKRARPGRPGEKDSKSLPP